MRHTDKVAVSGRCTVVWNAITAPNKNEDGTVQNWSIKLVCPPNDPDLRDLQAIADQELATGLWKGKLPVGGRPAIGTARAEEFNDMFPGYAVINPKTWREAPKVYDMNGNVLSPIVYASQLYQGAIVEVMVQAFSYDKKSKGVSFSLDAIRIVDATTPRLNLGGSSVDTGAVFGKPASNPPPPPGPGGPPPAPDFLDPTGPPAGYQMTPAAAGTTYKAFRDAGWTDAQLLAHGKMIAV